MPGNTKKKPKGTRKSSGQRVGGTTIITGIMLRVRKNKKYNVFSHNIIILSAVCLVNEY